MRTTRQSVKVRLSTSLSLLCDARILWRQTLDVWWVAAAVFECAVVKKKVIGLHKYSSKNETAFYGDFVQFRWWCYCKPAWKSRLPSERKRANRPNEDEKLKFARSFRLMEFYGAMLSFLLLLLFCPIHSANVCSPKISSKFAAHRCFNNFFIALFLFPFSVVFRIFLLVFRWCFFFAARRNVMRAKFGRWLEILTVRTLIFAWHIVWCFSLSVRNERKSDAAKTKIGRLLRFFFAFTVLSSKKRRIVIFVNST